jgi:hypothetical protein
MSDTTRQIADLYAQARARRFEEFQATMQQAMRRDFPDLVQILSDVGQFIFFENRAEYHFTLESGLWKLRIHPNRAYGQYVIQYVIQRPDCTAQVVLNEHCSFQDDLLTIIENYTASPPPAEAATAPEPLRDLAGLVLDLGSLLSLVMPRRRNGQFVLNEAERARSTQLLHDANMALAQHGVTVRIPTTKD